MNDQCGKLGVSMNLRQFLGVICAKNLRESGILSRPWVASLKISIDKCFGDQNCRLNFEFWIKSQTKFYKVNWVVKRYILIRIWCSNYLHCLKNHSNLFASSSCLILSVKPKCCIFESISCLLAAIYLVYFFLQLYKRVKYPGYN